MRIRFGLAIVAIMVMCLTAVAQAQPGGGRRPGGFGPGGFGGGFGLNRLTLLRIEAVQKELEMTDDQIEAIGKLQEEFRGPGGFGGFGAPGGDRGRGGRGEGGQRGDGERRRPDGGDRPQRPDGASLQAEPGFYFVQEQEQPERPRFQDLSEEERRELFERLRKEAEERQKQVDAKIGEILLPHQLKRLNEIYIQVQGIRALEDEQVAKELKISDKQKEEMALAREEAGNEMREQIRELFQGGGAQANREEIQAKMAELRTKSEEKVLAVLSAEQKKQFDALKGKPFELPQGALFGGFGGPGGRGPGGPGGPGGRPGGQRSDGEGRPQRPARPEA